MRITCMPLSSSPETGLFACHVTTNTCMGDAVLHACMVPHPWLCTPHATRTRSSHATCRQARRARPSYGHPAHSAVVILACGTRPFLSAYKRDLGVACRHVHVHTTMRLAPASAMLQFTAMANRCLPACVVGSGDGGHEHTEDGCHQQTRRGPAEVHARGRKRRGVWGRAWYGSLACR